MPSITSAGVGSGLDINGILAQLMALERRPLATFAQQEAKQQLKLSAYGTLKAALAAFQSAMAGLKSDSKFKVYKAVVEDQTVFTASAGSTAAAGSYAIEVVQLAAAHRVNSQRYADKDTTTVGASGDKIRIQVGADANNAFEVTIGGKTLEQIRDAINAATDNVGVTATIVPDYDPGAGIEYYRLVLASDETGTSHAITLSFEDSNNNAIADPMGFTELAAAQDAKLKVQGYLAVRSSNTVTDVIDGVTLGLEAATASGVTKRLVVERDTGAVVSAVEGFVKAYNDLARTVRKLTAYNAETRQAAALQGDASVLSAASQLRRALTTPIAGLSGPFTMSQIGIAFQADGTLWLDSAKLQAAMDSNLDGVIELFTSPQGYAQQLERLATGLLSADGPIESRTAGIERSIEGINDRREAFERRLEDVERRYRQQFMALDRLVAQWRATSDFLVQQLANLPGSGALLRDR